MSLLGKVYLLVSLTLAVLCLVWAAMILRDNPAWVPISLWFPSWAPDGLWQARHYEISTAALLAGWLTTFGLMGLYAIRAPFRIRAAAVAQRRVRALEREVLELRTLPLRQAEEDDMLAAEARLGGGPQRVLAGVVTTRDGPGSGPTARAAPRTGTSSARGAAAGAGERVDSSRESP
ncbi:MAG: hypothetical protein JNL82_08660 [Myxococcales bacterium]|nr:hypothetical protein [Myxococcales bacterium]